jgi:hypothetical protein
VNGQEAADVPPDYVEEMPDLDSTFNDQWV